MAEEELKFGVDAYNPEQVAARIEQVGATKAALPAARMLPLSGLAGIFIAFGAQFYLLAVTNPQLGFGPTKVLGGLVFSLGLVLVIVAGAELFTGNNLIVLAYASKKVTLRQLLRNWLLVYEGNFIGALLMAIVVWQTGLLGGGDKSTPLGETAVTIAAGKCDLPFVQAFARGILCNALVCLAVWLCMSCRSTTDKILAIVFPITAFVACGFEHCVANMYLIPLGLLVAGAEMFGDGLSWASFFVKNLIPVSLGNVVGGAVGVGLVYWFSYRGPGRGSH